MDEKDKMDPHCCDEKYSDKEQIIALVLSIVLGGVGAGRWYIGNWEYGFLMLALFIVLLGTVFLVICKYKKVNVIGYFLWGLAFLIWLVLVS